MAPRSYTFNTPTNPLLQVVYFIVGSIVLIGAVLMGAVILAIALGVAIILGIVIYVRVWWLQRKLRRSRGTSAEDAEVLEVEYSVVDERDDRRTGD
jgi:Flp pilus assembly protein TadB